MSIIRTKLAKTALSATTLAFTFGYLGCAHAKTTDNNGTQTSNQATGQASGSDSSMNQATNRGSAETPGSNTPEDAQTRDMMKFSHNGHEAIDAIQLARVAIFDGHPKTAVQLMDKAQTSIDAALREAPDFKMPANTTGTHTASGSKVNSNQMNGLGATMVPVDARMSLGEDYVATPEKQSHLDKANQHLKNGETKQAVDELRLAGVDVNFTLVLMPIDTSRQDLQQAIRLANSGKYYESNLELKKIEDSLILTRESLINAPKSTSKSNETTHHSTSTHPSN